MNDQNGMVVANLLDVDRRTIKKLKTVDGHGSASGLAWSGDGAFLVTLVSWPPVTYVVSRDGTYTRRLRGPRTPRGTDFGSENFSLSVH